MTTHQRSWVSLVTFCAVTVLVVALGSAVLLAGASVAFAVARPSPAELAVGSPTESVPANDGTVGNQIAAQSPAVPPLDDQGNAAKTSFAGLITDSRCGARHRRNSGKTSAECVRSCVHKGAGYVLVDGEKTYALVGDATQLEKVAGERASVSGTLKDNTITVKSVPSEVAQ